MPVEKTVYRWRLRKALRLRIPVSFYDTEKRRRLTIRVSKPQTSIEVKMLVKEGHMVGVEVREKILIQHPSHWTKTIDAKN